MMSYTNILLNGDPPHLN